MAARHDDSVVATAAAHAATDPGSVLNPDVDLTVPGRPAEPGAPAPDLRKTGEALARPAARSAALTIIAVLGVLYTLYFARGFLVPITFALLLNLLLSPALRALARLGLRPPIGAAILVLSLIAVIIGTGYALASPVSRWAAAAPAALTKAEKKIRKIIKPVETVSRTARQVEQAAGAIGGPASDVESVVVRTEQSLGAKLAGNAERLVTSFLEIMILLFFLLAGGDLFLQKLIKVLPQLGDRVKAVEVARATEAAVSAYLSTALVLNVGEGLIVALLLWGLDMPTPNRSG